MLYEMSNSIGFLVHKQTLVSAERVDPACFLSLANIALETLVLPINTFQISIILTFYKIVIALIL